MEGGKNSDGAITTQGPVKWNIDRPLHCSSKCRYQPLQFDLRHRHRRERRLIALDADSADPIDVLVSSPRGHLESGDAIHDIVRFIAAPVNMIGTGWVGSAATHLYLAVPRERRYCLPNTRFLIHQPSGGAGGPASDIAIQAREIVKARERIARTIARETGKSLEVALADIERDRWMSAEEAVEYGLVSQIIERKAELRGA